METKYAIRCETEEEAIECIKSIYIELNEPKESLEQIISWFNETKNLPIILNKESNDIMCTVGENMNQRLEEEGYTIISYQEAKRNGLLNPTKGLETYPINPNGEKITKELLQKNLRDKIEEPKVSNEQLIEDIIKDWIGTHGEQRGIYWREMKEILNKHLSK